MNAKQATYGIFGGTFDPIHSGHLKMALEVLRLTPLKKLAFLPAGQSPSKHPPRAPAHHRLAMLEIALSPHDDLEILQNDLHHRGPSFSINTLEKLQQQFPHRTWHWILGEDQFASLPQWHHAEKLISKVHFYILPRPHNHPPHPTHPQLKAHLLPITPHPLSSTQIRQKIRTQQPFAPHLPPAVAPYILQHHLYGS